MRTSQLCLLNHKVPWLLLTKSNPKFKDPIIIIAGNAGLSIFIIILFSTPFLTQVQASLIRELSDSARNPFGAGGGPPEIVMINNNTQYPGELRNYIWREGDVNDNTPVIEAPRSRLNESLFSSNNITIPINKDSEVTFLVKENPAPEAQPDVISVSAYTLAGQTVKVLAVSENKRDTFRIDLSSDQYILLAVATWLPNFNQYLNVEGYVTYIFKVSIID